MKANKKSLIYANSKDEDNRYILEAEQSCESFKKYIKDADSVLYCDSKQYQTRHFDKIEQTMFSVPDVLKSRMHKRGQMLVKHKAMLETAYDYNLVLGSDTYALSDKVNSIFELLEEFDIAVAHAPFRVVSMPDSEPIPVPLSFPEFNCDVIAYRKNDKVLAFIEQWQASYREDKFGHPHDQGTFRYLLFHSNLRVATLPPEFNYRGAEYRSDTVILQNRDSLYLYLNVEKQAGKKPGLLHKIKSKIKA